MKAESISLFGWAAVSAASVPLHAFCGRARWRDPLLGAIGVLCAIIAARFYSVGWAHLFGSCIKGIIVGVTVGFVLSLLAGFVRTNVPGAISKRITSAKEIIETLSLSDGSAAAPEMPQNLESATTNLEHLRDAAEHVVMGVVHLCGTVGLFNQGMASHAWRRLEEVRAEFERIGWQLNFFLLKRAAEARSDEMAKHWRSLADEQRSCTDTLNTAFGSLGARVTFYNIATALIVSCAALVATIIFGILQTTSTGSVQ